MDYSRFYNRRAKQMTESPIRRLAQQALQNPMLVSMAGGLPNPKTFPFVEAKVLLRDGSYLQLDESDFDHALQYSETNGFPQLLKWLKEFQKRIHNPPTYEAVNHPGCMDCLIVSGSMDGIYKTVACLVEEGDNVLVEQPSYPGFSVTLKNSHANILSVDSDENGINPNNLRQVLSRWKPSDAKNPKSGIPKLLYCIPSAGNPTGVTLAMKRKREIYKIAQEYNLIILEDDPYFFLQFSKPNVQSFLSIDVDGRVVRFDSFSKLVSAGMRIGFVSGPSPIIEKLALCQQTNTFHASGLSQTFLYKFLEKLGHDGFIQHLEKKKELYKQKRNDCVECLGKHLTGLAKWVVPSGGIFMWIRLLNIADSAALVLKALEQNVLVVPGKSMQLAKPDVPCPYIRVAYSIASKDDMDTVFRKIAMLLKREITNGCLIDDL